MKQKLNKGLSVIEVVIGAAIILVTVSATSLAFQAIIRSASLANHVTASAFLLEEGLEVAKLLRVADWNNIAGLNSGTAYTLVLTDGVWSTEAESEFIDGFFERTMIVNSVYRDSNQDIAPSGTLDPNTKEITVRVSWREHEATTTRAISTYVTNF